MKWNIDRSITKLAEHYGCPIEQVRIENVLLNYDDCKQRKIVTSKRFNDGKPHPIWTIHFPISKEGKPLVFQGYDIHDALLIATKRAKRARKLARKGFVKGALDQAPAKA